MVAKHDKVVEDRIVCGPQNATYTSACIQNLILKILGDIVRNVVCNGVKEAEMFSFLVDETKDLRNKWPLYSDMSIVRECFMSIS